MAKGGVAVELPEPGEVLVWEKLAACVDNFREELHSWSSEERSKALQRREEALQVQQEAAEVAEALGVEVSAEEPWEHLSQLLCTAKAQRDQVSEICGLLRKHGKMLEGSKLKEQIPEDGAILKAVDLQRLVMASLEYMAQKQPEETENTDKAGDKETQEASEEEVEEKKVRKGKKKSKAAAGKKEKEKRRRRTGGERTPAKESSASEDYSDYSRSPTPRPRRRRRKRRRRRPSPSSYSYSPAPRRPRRKRRRREDKLDVDAEIDRFVKVNKLEERCEKILRDLDSSLACKVMGLSGGNNTFELSGDVRDPTAVVLARIRKAQFAEGTRGGRRGGGRRRRSSSSRSR